MNVAMSSSFRFLYAKRYTTADVSTVASVLNLYVAVEMVKILNYLVVKYLQSMLMQCDLPPLQWWIALHCGYNWY